MTTVDLDCGCTVVADGWTFLPTIRCDTHRGPAVWPHIEPATPPGSIAERVAAAQRLAVSPVLAGALNVQAAIKRVVA